MKGQRIAQEPPFAWVRQAMARGLVGGRHLTVDATTVAADALLESLEPLVVAMSPQQYVEQLDPFNPPAPTTEAEATEDGDSAPAPS
jgi:hypothetical protein